MLENVNWPSIAISSVVSFGIGILVTWLSPRIFHHLKPFSRIYRTKPPPIEGKELTTEAFEGMKTYTRTTVNVNPEGQKVVTKEVFYFEP